MGVGSALLGLLRVHGNNTLVRTTGGVAFIVFIVFFVVLARRGGDQDFFALYPGR